MKRVATAFFLGAAALAQGAGAPPSRAALAVLPSGRPFTLEVADDPASRARGYMFRELVGAGEGMLFVFEEEAPHSFWMKNCRVSLDLVWLDAGFRIVHIAADARPCPESGDCPSILPSAPARYAIEFAAGTVAKESLRVGDYVSVLRTPAAP